MNNIQKETMSNAATSRKKYLGYLQKVLLNLDVSELKSMLFLLMNDVTPYLYLEIVNKERCGMEEAVAEIIDLYACKEALLVEILTTMQKFNLLKIFGLCSHIMKKDIITFNQIPHTWKCLYRVCEQLTELELISIKFKLFPNINIHIQYSAEEIFCMAFIKKIFNCTNLDGLTTVLQNVKPGIESLLLNQVSERINYYPIRRPTEQSPCGIALLLNNDTFSSSSKEISLEPRNGSGKDLEALKKLWNSFGFLTLTYTNLTKKETEDLFKCISKEDHSSFDIFVTCLMSHGDEGIIFSSDSEPVQIQQLIDITANKTPTLLNKPKLFFIQACQGSYIQYGANQTAKFELIPPMKDHSLPNIMQSMHIMDTPQYTDVLKFLSTIPRFVSFRDQYSWFMQSLVEVIQCDGEELTIMSIVTKVTKMVTQKRGSMKEYKNVKQTPINESTLRCEVKLKRKIC